MAGRPPSRGPRPLATVACGTGTFCIAVDGEGDAYYYVGRWSSGPGLGGGPSAVSCVSPTFCVATVGGTTEWNGQVWSRPSDVDPLGRLDAVSCTSPSFCVAADTVGNVLAWNGSSWSVPQPVDPGAAGAAIAPHGITAVSCIGATFCVAVDDGGWPSRSTAPHGRHRRTSTITRASSPSPAPRPRSASPSTRADVPSRTVDRPAMLPTAKQPHAGSTVRVNA